MKYERSTEMRAKEGSGWVSILDKAKRVRGVKWKRTHSGSYIVQGTAGRGRKKVPNASGQRKGDQALF